jgi:hypothetical protein
MEKVKQLLQAYLNEELTSEEFVTQFLNLWRKMRDEVYVALEIRPNLKHKYNKLSERYHAGKISQADYLLKLQELIPSIANCEMKPNSKEDEILSHLMVEADAYRENPEDRQAGLHIGDAELKDEALKALQLLTE